MPRTAPLSVLLLQRLRCDLPRSPTSPPSAFWSPIAAFAAATERATAGALSPVDAHRLFDGLLRQATPVAQHSLNDLLDALARAPSTAACTDGPALAIGLFKRVCREEATGQQAAPFTDHTYRILVQCCCRAGRPDLAPAFFGRFLKTGLSSGEVVADTIRRCLPTSPPSEFCAKTLRRWTPHSSTPSTSPPPEFWSPIAAFYKATHRVRAGTLSPEDAHHLFDKLLRQTIPVAQGFLNSFLTALARAPASSACRDGPALAVALFNRVCREEGGPRLAPLSVHTYNIVMDSCCCARRPDIGLAIFGRLLRTGLKTTQITASTFLKCLCYAKQTDEAVNVLLHRMPELGGVPDAVSYSIVMKGLCDDGRSQQALDLLQMVLKEGGACTLNVVVYSTVIHGLFKGREVIKACNVYHEMMRQGVVPNVVIYRTIIHGLIKEGELSKAELFLRQMVDAGVQLDKVAYDSNHSMVHIYSSLGRWKEARKISGEMISRGLIPNIGTSAS